MPESSSSSSSSSSELQTILNEWKNKDNKKDNKKNGGISISQCNFEYVITILLKCSDTYTIGEYDESYPVLKDLKDIIMKKISIDDLFNLLLEYTFYIPSSLMPSLLSSTAIEFNKDDDNNNMLEYIDDIITYLTSSVDSPQYMNIERATILTKKCFEVYNNSMKISNNKQVHNDNDINNSMGIGMGTYLTYVTKLLKALNDNYPSTMLVSSCAGKVSGIEKSIKPMLYSISHDNNNNNINYVLLSIIISMIQYSIKGAPNNNANKNLFTINNRKKFIKSLIDWKFLYHFIQCLLCNDNNMQEEMCDALFTIIDMLLIDTSTSASAKDDDHDNNDTSSLLGEELLFNVLGTSTNGTNDNVIKQLVQYVNDSSSEQNATSIARVLFSLYECIVINSAKPIQQSITNNNNTSEKTKTLSNEFITQMHTAYIQNISTIISSMDITSFQQQNMYVLLNTNTNNNIKRNKKIKNSFTIRRYVLFKLFVHMIEYDHYHYCHEHHNNSSLLNSIMKLPMPTFYLIDSSTKKLLKEIIKYKDKGIIEIINTELEQVNDDDPQHQGYILIKSIKEDKQQITTIPYPNIIDMLYYYFPNNDLFHYSFYRLYFIILLSHDPNTQRIIFTNCKFLTRAINTILLLSDHHKDAGKQQPQPHTIMNYGVLLRCLNALRLYYQYVTLLLHTMSNNNNSNDTDSDNKKKSSLFYLKHYLDSHEQWKSMQDALVTITLQQQNNNGLIVPTSTNNTIDNNDDTKQNQDNKTKTSIIDLGSAYALELGFDVDKLLTLDKNKLQHLYHDNDNNDGHENENDKDDKNHQHNANKKKKKKNKKKKGKK